MLCDSAAAATTPVAHHHHGAEMSGDGNAVSAPGPELRAVSNHDCSDHQTGVREAATTTAVRADTGTVPGLMVTIPVHDSISTLTDSDPVFAYRTPPAINPPTTSPLVLRV